MWLWLSIQLIAASLPHPDFICQAVAAETSSGPATAEEARILWTDGKKAYDNARYQDAVNFLQRLVDRYPGYEGYLEAHRLLGRSLMQLGRFDEAEKPLKQYIADTGDRDLSLQARLWLGDDQLKLSQPNEAYLTALEVEKATKASHSQQYAESQFLKARALIALNRDEHAQRVLDSVERTPAVQSDNVLKGYSAQARIELKLRHCSKFPPKIAMDEAQARDQFTRRALCLEEALTLFRTAAESRELPTGEDAVEKIYQGYSAYAQATRTPPAPKGERTQAQKRQYRAELADRLAEDRKKTLRETLSTLAEWKQKAAPSAASTLSELSKKIESLL